MKDEACDVGIKEFVELKPTMYLFLVNDAREHKKQIVWIQMLLQKATMVHTKMFCWIRSVSGIRWIEF